MEKFGDFCYEFLTAEDGSTIIGVSNFVDTPLTTGLCT